MSANSQFEGMGCGMGRITQYVEIPLKISRLVTRLEGLPLRHLPARP
jgi:hypothetical protein